ncbi:hypothetical protein DdX_21645 [Ditylenchus destructor]|uniref:Uncharacterized protein n=1 Tax=Ditylenchus destructor TaxID=166010 RepID=A0AAD4MJC7_9BILA|nr:hypothetical protein DdX_21645 [Ditylenchus destructor]
MEHDSLEIESFIPSASSTEPRVEVEIGQIAVDPVANPEDDITSNAVILTKLESAENVSTVPIGRRSLDLQAALSSFVPIDVEANEVETNSVTTKALRKQRISRKKRSHLGDSSSNSVGKKKRMSLPQQSAEHVPDVSTHPDQCSTANEENAYNSEGGHNDEITKENDRGKSNPVKRGLEPAKRTMKDFRKLVAGMQQMVRKTVQEEVGHLQPSTSRNTATYQQSTSKLSKPAKKDARKESHKKGQDFDGTHDKFLHALKYAKTFMEFGNDPYEIMVMTKDGAGEGIVGQKTFNPKVKDLIWALSNYKHIQDEISHKLLGLTLVEDFYDWWVHPENGWKQMAEDIQEAWRDRCTQRQADQKERNDRAKKNTSGVTKKSTPRVWGSAANKKINTACGNWTANEKNRGKPGYEPKFPSFDWNHAPDDVALSQITFRLVDPTKKGPDGKKADLNYDALRSLIYKTYKEEVGKKDDSSERKEFLQPYLGNKHDKNKGLLKLQEKRTGSANAQTSKNDPKKTATVSSRRQPKRSANQQAKGSANKNATGTLKNAKEH